MLFLCCMYTEAQMWSGWLPSVWIYMWLGHTGYCVLLHRAKTLQSLFINLEEKCIFLSCSYGNKQPILSRVAQSNIHRICLLISEIIYWKIWGNQTAVHVLIQYGWVSYSAVLSSKSWRFFPVFLWAVLFYLNWHIPNFKFWTSVTICDFTVAPKGSSSSRNETPDFIIILNFGDIRYCYIA